jgi:hypothetical protein
MEGGSGHQVHLSTQQLRQLVGEVLDLPSQAVAGLNQMGSESRVFCIVRTIRCFAGARG